MSILRIKKLRTATHSSRPSLRQTLSTIPEFVRCNSSTDWSRQNGLALSFLQLLRLSQLCLTSPQRHRCASGYMMRSRCYRLLWIVKIFCSHDAKLRYVVNRNFFAIETSESGLHMSLNASWPATICKGPPGGGCCVGFCSKVE